MLIAIIWLWFKRKKPHLLSAIRLLILIAASTALTQYALTAERYPFVVDPIHALPDLTLLYLTIHYILVLWLVTGYIFPSSFYKWGLWTMLFLYPSYLYFRTFFLFEVGTPFPILYVIVIILISNRSVCTNPDASPSSGQFAIFSSGIILSLLSFLFLCGLSTILSAAPGESLNQYFQIFCFAFLSLLLAYDLAIAQSFRAITIGIVISGGVVWVLLAGIKFGMLINILGLTQTLHYRLCIADTCSNHISYPLVTLLPLCLGLGLTAKNRWYKLAWGNVIVGMLLTLIYTQSNTGYSGWIGLFLGMVTMVILLKWPNIKAWWAVHPLSRPTILIAGSGLIIFIIISGISIARRINSYSLFTRLYGWRTILYQIADYPFFGSGLGVRHITARFGDRVMWDDVNTTFEWLVQEPLNQRFQQNQLSFHTHSIFFEIAVGAGVLALAAFLWFLWELAMHSLAVLHHAAGPHRVLIAAYIAGIVASLGWGLIDVMEFTPIFFTFPVWVLVGLLMSTPSYQTCNHSVILSSYCGFQIAEYRARSLVSCITHLVLCAAHHLSRIMHSTPSILRLTFFLPLSFAIVAMPLIGNWHYTYAYTAFQEHRWAVAEQELAHAALWEPFNAKYLQLRGAALINLGQYSDAIAVYEHALNLKRDFSPYYSQLGWLYWLQGDMEQGIKNFQKAVEIDPKEVWQEGLHADLGLAFVAQGRMEEAIQLFKEAIELNPQMTLAPYWVRIPEEGGRFDMVLDPVYFNPQPITREIDEAMRTRILAHLGKEDYTPRQFNIQVLVSKKTSQFSGLSFNRVLDAIEVDQKAASNNRSSEAPRLLATLAEAARAAGLYKRVESAYLFYQTSFPTSEYGFRELGTFYFEQGRLEEAQVMLERAVQVSPTDIDSWLALAEVYLNQEMYGTTLEKIDTVYRLSPLNGRLYELRAQLYQQQGDLARAAINLSKALVIKESIPNRLTLSNLYRQLKKPQQAVEQCLLAADALQRSWPPPLDEQLSNIANCLVQSNLKDDELLNQQICKPMNMEICYILLGHIHRAQREFEQALLLYKEAVVIRPDDGAPHYFIGQTYQAMGRFTESEAEYNQAVELSPMESLPLLTLGHLQWGQGKKEEALKSFYASVMATPGWSEAHMALGDALLASGDNVGATVHFQLAQIADSDVREDEVYDFAIHLASAKIQSPGPDYVRNDYFTINSQDSSFDSERQRVLFMHPNSSASYTITVPKGSVMAFNLAMSPDSWTQAGDGVTFKIDIISDGITEQVFSTYINPKHNMSDRRWYPNTVDLSHYTGQTVTIIFKTDCGLAGDCRFDWAGWGEPRLLQP